MVNDILRRIAATFAVAALGTVGAGALFGVDTWKSAAMAGAGAIAVVLEALSRAFLNDGNLSKEEVDAIFNKFATDGKQEEVELEPEEAEEIEGH